MDIHGRKNLYRAGAAVCCVVAEYRTASGEWMLALTLKEPLAVAHSSDRTGSGSDRMLASSNASKYGTASGSDRMLHAILVSMSIQGFTLIIQNIGYGTARLLVSPEVAFAAAANPGTSLTAPATRFLHPASCVCFKCDQNQLGIATGSN